MSHERVHTRDRPFECPECRRRFPQKRHLTTHIKFHSGERPYSCSVSICCNTSAVSELWF